MFFILYLHFVYPSGKPMIRHRPACAGSGDPRCQGFAVNDYGFTLDALALAYPQLSLN
jgi:hypothetical protein